MLYHFVSCVVVVLTFNKCLGFRTTKFRLKLRTTLLFKQVMLLNNVVGIWKFYLMQSLD